LLGRLLVARLWLLFEMAAFKWLFFWKRPFFPFVRGFESYCRLRKLVPPRFEIELRDSLR
jgi:hypothetical protein